MHIALTIIIFAITMMLVLVRPRGLPEAWATIIGGGLMLACGIVTPHQALDTITRGGDVLLFLLGLLIFSDLLRASHFFEWCAIHAARAAKGDTTVLYRNVFILGAITTAFLSLDTTAVILTPIVLAFVGRLRLQSRPFLIACAFIANTGSLLLPVSNLTNLLFVSAFHWNFAEFSARMLLPQVAALAANYWLFLKLFAKELPGQFDASALPQADSILVDVPYFRGAVAVLVIVTVGYFIGSINKIAPYVIALSGSVMLFAWGAMRRQVSLRLLRDISWSIFPFVIGLFVVVRGVETAGITAVGARILLSHGTSPVVHLILTAAATAFGSNVVNNIPMALLAISSLQHNHNIGTQYAALLGCNIGPNLTIAGSLATMLVITSARREGDSIGAMDFFKTGLRVTPLVLIAACLGLWLAISL